MDTSSSSVRRVGSYTHDKPRPTYPLAPSARSAMLFLELMTGISSGRLPRSPHSPPPTSINIPLPQPPSSTQQEAAMPYGLHDDLGGTILSNASLDTHVQTSRSHSSIHPSLQYISLGECVAREGTSSSPTTQPQPPPLKIAGSLALRRLAVRASSVTPAMSLPPQIVSQPSSRCPRRTTDSVPFTTPTSLSLQATLWAPCGHVEAAPFLGEATIQLNNLPTDRSLHTYDAVWSALPPDLSWLQNVPSSPLAHHETMIRPSGYSESTFDSHHGHPSPDRTERPAMAARFSSLPSYPVPPFPNQPSHPLPPLNTGSSLRTADTLPATSPANLAVGQHYSEFNTAAIDRDKSFDISRSDYDTARRKKTRVFLSCGQGEPYTSTMSSEIEVALQTLQHPLASYGVDAQYTGQPPSPSQHALRATANPRSYNDRRDNSIIPFLQNSPSSVSGPSNPIQATSAPAISPLPRHLPQHGVATSVFNRAYGGTISQMLQSCDAIASVPLSLPGAAATMQGRGILSIQPPHSPGAMRPIVKTSRSGATNVPHQTSCETQVISQHHSLHRHASHNFPEAEIQSRLHVDERNSSSSSPNPFHTYNTHLVNNPPVFSPVSVTDASSQSRSAPPSQTAAHLRPVVVLTYDPIHQDSSQAGPSQPRRPGRSMNGLSTLQVPPSSEPTPNTPNLSSPTPRSPRRTFTMLDGPKDNGRAKKARLSPSASVPLTSSGSSDVVPVVQKEMIPAADADVSGHRQDLRLGVGKVHTLLGCFKCRERRKRCTLQQDEQGRCLACRKLGLECPGGYGLPKPRDINPVTLER
ncbi:hypothetical protein DL93DRAFT_2153841 [Clavulina sp. PMI_390]|nr:hypothetical protein DL93DRAFT_2153841 [Clavulina sp. PMI_390]